MSVVTTLALMATALKAAVGREQQAHMKTRARLWPERDGAAAELAEAKRKVAELEGDIAELNRQARRDQELIDIWRMRALAPQPAGPDFRPPQLAQEAALQMQAQQMMASQSQLAAQYNQQAAMNAQNFYSGAQQGLGQSLGLLGAQMIDAELWCNCVPSRSQVWGHRA